MKKLAPFALLLLSAPALAQTSPNPTGEGEPFAITCRPPQTLPGSRLKGPEVCKTNQVWALYRADGMAPAADGIHDVPSERWRSTNPAACRAATPGGGGTASMVYANFSMICE